MSSAEECIYEGQALCEKQYMEDMNRGALGKQVGGSHYKTTSIQPWNIIDAHNLNYYEGNAIKYILRKKSNRVEDLEKAIHYLEKVIEDIK